MIDIEQECCQEHERGVKDIDIKLVLLKSSVVTDDILDNAEYRSDHDERACEVQNPKEFLPWDCDLGRLLSWGLGNSMMEDRRDEYEKAEGDDLDG